MSEPNDKKPSSEHDFPRTPRTEHGPSYIPPHDNTGNDYPSQMEDVKTWAQEHKRALITVGVVAGAYLLNKRAIRKVVSKELLRFHEIDKELALNPDWQLQVFQSMATNGLLSPNSMRY